MPVLGYVIVGNNMESELYVRLKKKACDQMGIEYEGYHLSSTVTQSEVMDCVRGMQ